jgi:predicted O-methyltransferase YrrM
MTHEYNKSYNQQLKYNYQEENKYNPKTHPYYGSVSQVLHLIDNKKDLVIAEIGVFRGESTLAMLNYCDVKKIYLIDPFDKKIADQFNSNDGTNVNIHSNLFEETKTKLEKFKEKIIFLKEISDTAFEKIQDDELDFLFIDGCHAYECVYKDLINYYSKVKKGGIIAGDDFSNKFSEFGIIDAVNDVLPTLGYKEVNLYKHSYKPKDYYSSFAFEKI